MTHDRAARIVVFVVVVSLASMFFGACWGQWAGMMYGWSPAMPRELWKLGGPSLVLDTAVHLGWTSGLAVALWWCARTAFQVRRAESGSQDRKGISRGDVKLGVAAGLISTLVVHLGLVAWFAVVMRRWVGWPLVFNLAAGLLVGGLTGALVGWCGGALRRWLGGGHEAFETHSTAQPGGGHDDQGPADEE